MTATQYTNKATPATSVAGPLLSESKAKASEKNLLC